MKNTAKRPTAKGPKTNGTKNQKSLTARPKKSGDGLIGGLTFIGLYIFVFFTIAVLRLKGKSVSEVITFTRRVVTMMTGNPNFTDPAVPMADMTVAVDALAVAEEAMDGSKAKTIVRNARLAEVKYLLNKQVTYVNLISGGNPEIAVTSGYDIRDPRNPVGLLAFPSDFVALSTPVAGQVSLKWKAVKKRTSYVIEYSLDPENGKVFNVECTKASILLNGLTRGALYFFRIATLSAAGNGGFSPWVECRPK